MTDLRRKLILKFTKKGLEGQIKIEGKLEFDFDYYHFRFS